MAAREKTKKKKEKRTKKGGAPDAIGQLVGAAEEQVGVGRRRTKSDAVGAQRRVPRPQRRQRHLRRKRSKDQQ